MPRTPAQAVGFLLGIWLAFALSPLWARSARGEEPSPYYSLEAELFDEINRVRAEHHLIALARRPDLDAVARAHSEDMAVRGYFSHDTPEGANPLDRIRAAALEDMSLAAENLGRTTERNPTRALVASWLHSPDHRRNLLAPAFNTTGLGIAVGRDGALLITQVYVHLPR